MRRDMDLIRLLLLDIEGEEEVDLSDYTEDQILYHRHQLVGAKLISGESKVRFLPDGTRIYYTSKDYLLTFEGHDFLDDTRDITVWKKVKEKVAEKGSTVSWTVITAIAKKIVMDGFGL